MPRPKKKEEIPQDILAEYEQKLDVDVQYDDKAEVGAARDVELPTEAAGGAGHASLTDAIDNTQDLTDIQFIVRKLIPTGLDGGGIRGRSVDAAVTARIHPEAYLSLIRLGVRSDIMRSDSRKAFDTYGSLIKWIAILSPALDGRSRIELAECAGAAREARRSEGLAGLGVS